MDYDELKAVVAKAIRRWNDEHGTVCRLCDCSADQRSDGPILDDGDVAALMFEICDELRTTTDIHVKMEMPYQASGRLSELGR